MNVANDATSAGSTSASAAFRSGAAPARTLVADGTEPKPMGNTAAALGFAVNIWDGEAPVGCVLHLAQPDPTGPPTETNPHKCPAGFMADVANLTFHLTE
jgi:hypothetical protein